MRAGLLAALNKPLTVASSPYTAGCAMLVVCAGYMALIHYIWPDVSSWLLTWVGTFLISAGLFGVGARFIHGRGWLRDVPPVAWSAAGCAALSVVPLAWFSTEAALGQCYNFLIVRGRPYPSLPQTAWAFGAMAVIAAFSTVVLTRWAWRRRRQHPAAVAAA